MKVKSILHLNNKWIKTMLIVSVLVITALMIYPDKQPVLMLSKNMPEMSDTIFYDNTNEGLDTVVNTKSAPIQIQIVRDSQPFDWKGMISWIIGAINGVVLLVMNIKTIRKK